MLKNLILMFLLIFISGCANQGLIGHNIYSDPYESLNAADTPTLNTSDNTSNVTTLNTTDNPQENTTNNTPNNKIELNSMAAHSLSIADISTEGFIVGYWSFDEKYGQFTFDTALA